MMLVKPSAEIIAWHCSPELIERAGRTCYKSEPKGDPEGFCLKINQLGHHSVLEHSSISVLFTIDRGVSHELVRHRLASFSQESTRYCNYGKQGHVTFVIPPWVDIEPGAYGRAPAGRTPNVACWAIACRTSELVYLDMLKNGWTPQQARSVLPNSLKTEIVMTANAREWLHVFKLRTATSAHPQMREVMIPLQRSFAERIPVLFG